MQGIPIYRHSHRNHAGNSTSTANAYAYARAANIYACAAYTNNCARNIHLDTAN